ncbi:MAG: translation initiation factor IF-3 [Candidatus Nomurabacteria bacterium]|nr:MAG: translation initiation factor IF-3 [Candidatus Nomurabacteria bacterium]HRV76083.1 translation initiation factor IF-3 [Candidatus Saccharimonadales bacterium]
MRRRSRNAAPKARINRNHQIRAETLRVISEEGDLLGIMSKQEALKIAEEQGKDLIEISANSDPAVARIMEFGKFKYQQERKDRAAKKTAHVTEVKQVRISLKIGQHDLDTKLKKMKVFLEEGHKVRVTMMLKGRENAHQDLGFLRLEEISGTISEWADIDQPAKLNGRNISIIYRHKN